MGSKAKVPAAPDYTPIANASREAAAISAEVAREQLAWAKEEFAYNKGVLDQVLDIQLPAMKAEAEAGAALRTRYNEVFQPMEDDLVKEAQEYDSPERREQEASRVTADVTNAFDAQRNNALARLESFGVDPSQTRSQALDAGMRTQQAAATAAASNQARTNVENVGRALRGEAINIGKGLPSNIAGAYGTALQAGNSSIANSINTTNSGANTMGTANQWMGTQNQALGSWSGALNTGFQNQMSNYNAKAQQQRDTMGAIGSVAGMAAGSGFGSSLMTRAGKGLMGAIGFSEGGEVPHDPDDPEGKLDGYAIRVAGGEHIVPASVVRRLGSDHFDKLIARYGDEEDRRAAAIRLSSGKPGGETGKPAAIPVKALG